MASALRGKGMIGAGIALCVMVASGPGATPATHQAIAAVAVGVPGSATITTAGAAAGSGLSTRSTARTLYNGLPLTFAPSGRGQEFTARGASYTLSLTPGAATMYLSGAVRPGMAARASALRVSLMGASTSARLAGVDRQQGTVNYFTGKPSSWRSGVPTFGGVEVRQAYRGVTLHYYGTQGRVEYDVRVAAGASAAPVRERISGARSVRLERNGDLRLAVASGAVTWARPVAYQVVRGRRVAVRAAYRLLDARTIGFALGHYNHALPLVIDPVLSYASFFGYGDDITGIALDRSGNTYITGYTVATIITDTHMLQMNRVPTMCPVTSQNPCPDAFVAKISADNHRLVYATFLGGSAADQANGIAVDAAGTAYIAGNTTSLDFPVTSHAFQKKNRGGNDAFIAKLSPDGRALLYSTYLGGSTDNADTVGDDVATSIAVDSHGSAYVTGYTYSYNFPLKNPLQGSLGYGKGTLGTQVDAFVTKFTPSGSGLVYSTYLGGSLSDSATGIAVDGAGNAYVTGQTNSPDFPTPPHALQGQLYGTDYNSFVAKLDKWGKSLVYATYLGRTAADKTHGIAVDGAGNAYVVGETNGGIPRTVGVAQPTSGGGIDAFVAKLSDRGVLAYSTYLGGIGDDIGYGIALDSAGDAYIAGSTGSAAFNTPVVPLKSALQGSLGGNRGGFGMLDAFVAKVNSCGSALLYSSYLGGTFVDAATSIAVDSHGNAYLGGQSLSPNFPISHPIAGGGAYVPPSGNAFVAKISGSPPSPAGACPLALTLDTPPAVSSTGPLTVTVHTTPHALVNATLIVTNTVPPPPPATPVSKTAPKPPKAPKLGALLYRASVHGTADSYGLYVGIIRLKYAVTAPIPATVRVTIKRGAHSASTSTPIQLGP